jgi:hypothetical protein
LCLRLLLLHGPDRHNAGTLQQAVLTECIMSQVLAVPLLFVTRAHATCDWGLVASLSLFGVSRNTGRSSAVLSLRQLS